ncbi:protein VACUOLELESS GAMETOPHYTES-like [Syzygium oleosum]|uniref:protein VACUOLELESS GAMETOPHYTES-like n=1 Tax=Syzygium oleosum TaxID=219896 RepID=UPI0011D25FCE|nr:protein VACUOLELESS GAMETOPHYTES-like [Syzygium oleosum]
MNSLNNEAMPVFRHFSHEHPLELTNFSGAGTAVCSACNIQIIAGRDYYTCRACPFSLHRPCFNMPERVQHPADPSHDLNLLITPCFHCRACGHQGAGFSYHCHLCQVQYHPLCLLMPLAKRSHCHPHELHLKFSPPYGDSQGFRCDICGNPGSNHWLYRCEACELDVHLSCSSAASAPNPPLQPPAVPANNQNPRVVNHQRSV